MEIGFIGLGAMGEGMVPRLLAAGHKVTGWNRTQAKAEPLIQQGMVWAEEVWFPSVWVRDERVRWEPVDEVTALLFVPFGEQEENFVVRFDPETGMLDTMEAMRYRDAGPQAKKILWITKTLPGKYIEGTGLGAIGSATWFDQGKPWAVFTLEEVKYNVDVSEYIRQRGP